MTDRRSIRLLAATAVLAAALLAATPAAGAPAHPPAEQLGQRSKLPTGHVQRRAAPQCTGVAHVGDSTTVESDDQQIAAYRAYFARVVVDGGGGRAVLQTIPSDPHTGVGAVEAIRASGFTGCWVVAMGTNDAANISAGANYSREQVIDSMMATIDPTATTPVAWVEVFTSKTSGHWHRSNMVAWNEALHEATTRWPNLHVIPWAATVGAHPEWISDGIHHTAVGRAERANWIAEHAHLAFDH